MIFKLRTLLWRILGIDYRQVLKIHDYVFLKNDPFTQIGKHTYDNGAIVYRWTNAPLQIGKFCSIANGVKFIVDEAFHGAPSITSYPLVNNLYKTNTNLNSGKTKKEFLDQIEQKAGITIGNDVWIGMGAYIMPGVKIGNGVTIAANSVVTGKSDIPDYSIIGGVPAKVIKIKYDNQTVEELNKICWWEWDTETIKDRIEDFYKDQKAFLEKYKAHKNE